APDRNAESLHGARGQIILARAHVERPENDVAAKSKTARDTPLALPVRRIEVSTAGDLFSFAQRRIAIRGQRLDQHRGRRRRQIIRYQLLEQIGRELREFMLQLELD